MLINETQLPHLKVKPENLERHLRAAERARKRDKDGRYITITYNEQKGFEGDLFYLPRVGLVVLDNILVYSTQNIHNMARQNFCPEGFETPEAYLRELARCYPKFPEVFYVHTFLEINRRPADD